MWCQPTWGDVLCPGPLWVSNALLCFILELVPRFQVRDGCDCRISCITLRLIIGHMGGIFCSEKASFSSDHHHSSALSLLISPLQSNSRGLRWCQQLHHCQRDCEEGSGLSSSGQCWPKPGDHPAPELHHSLRQPEHRRPQHRQLRVAAEPQQQREGDGDAGQCSSPVFHLHCSLAGFLSRTKPVLMDS